MDDKARPSEPIDATTADAVARAGSTGRLLHSDMPEALAVLPGEARLVHQHLASLLSDPFE